MSTPTITLYTTQTPNGIKISITLEELGLPYTVKKIDAQINEQKTDWFREINPNQRIPAITDTLEDGTQVRVFESGSIMQYLIARYDKDFKISYPVGTKEHIEVLFPVPFESSVNDMSYSGLQERHADRRPRFAFSV